jgi:hypothetical protein
MKIFDDEVNIATAHYVHGCKQDDLGISPPHFSYNEKMVDVFKTQMQTDH